ncbi:MAG TPA: DUF4412 domain-containing protein [Bryobacteraceae bacterium]|nr:DUF4412 domain-containing protein [Bryobacteraceae bacterium]
MFRTTAPLCAIALTATLAAHADFSFSKTQKVTGGSMAAMAGNAANRESKSYFKDQKAAEVASDSTILMDFDAQTITTINKVQKTYRVQKFGDLAAAAGGANADMSVDVKDTGQTKTINGYNAKESLVTLNLDFAAGRGPVMKMAAEIEVWRSTDVPGAAEMRAFYQKNANNFPWAAMMGAGGNQSIQRAIAEVQKKLAESDGMVVEEVVRIKPAGAGPQAAQAPQMPQLTPEQQAKMQTAKAQMEAMSKQGGAQAAAAQRAMAAIAAMGAAPSAAGGSAGALIEITIDNTGFSTEAVPDSEFVVPPDYKKIP